MLDDVYEHCCKGLSNQVIAKLITKLLIIGLRKWNCVKELPRWQYRGVYTCIVLSLYSCLVSSLGAELSTVLFSHVVESWESTYTRNLLLFWNILYSYLVVSQDLTSVCRLPCKDVVQPIREQLAIALTNHKPQKGDTTVTTTQPQHYTRVLVGFA